MSIFNTGNIHSFTSLGANRPITEASAHESISTGVSAIIYENEVNFSSIMKAVGIQEINYLNENGRAIVYEGTTLSNFFTKMREFFKTIGRKIKELFNKFIMQIDAWIRKDETFVKKHRNTLLSINTRGFEYKGYKFTPEKADTKTALAATAKYLLDNNMKQANVGPHGTDSKVQEQDKWTNAWKTNKTAHIESMRAAAIGTNGKLTTKEYDDQLRKVFRDGQDEPVTIKDVSVSDLLGTISNFKDRKDAAKKSMDEIDKNIKAIIDDLTKQEKAIGKFNEKETETQHKGRAAAMRYVTELSTGHKDRLAVIQKLHGSLMTALKQENRQAKSICVRLVGYSPKAKNESGVVGGVNNVEFI